MIRFHEIKNIKVAELIDGEIIISSGQDALELMAETGFGNCNSIVIQEKNLHPDFFRLHTGIAGDVLQKFSNYKFRFAVIGDFTKYKSQNLMDFMRECNRGNRVWFVGNIDDALKKLIED
jgi:hypothetical protein